MSTTHNHNTHNTTQKPTYSGWPWMKDATVVINDPIPPVDDDDDRPSIRDLIQTHRTDIDALKANVMDDPLYEPHKHDDLWLLRFLLSHKGALKPATRAAKHCLQFRKDLSLDDKDLRHVHVGVDQIDTINPSAHKYVANCDPGTFRIVVHEKCIVSYVCYPGFDHTKLLQNLDKSDWLPAFCMQAEWCHQWTDYVTRTTGRLTKMVRLVDLEDLSLTKNCNPVAAARDGMALNAMEDVYPQLLQALYLIHAPIWIEGPWKTVRPMVPKRVLQKFDFLDPLKKEKHLARLLQYIDKERLPKRFGGNFEQWPDDTPPPNTIRPQQQVTDEVEI